MKRAELIKDIFGTFPFGEREIEIIEPVNPNGAVIIYHRGHSKFVFGEFLLINRLMSEGYSIVILDMPERDHEGNVLRIFLLPVIETVNNLSKDYEEIYMVGFSGGAWTTVLASAIDTRIKGSYQVAGTLPLDFILGGRDYEQKLPGIQANYRELYVMGSHKRTQTQILFDEDPCCFSGEQYLSKPYESDISLKLDKAGGGNFKVIIIQSRMHGFEEGSVNVIMEGLNTSPSV